MRLFVFKDALSFKGELKLNIKDKFWEVILTPEGGDTYTILVNPDVLKAGRQAMVLFSPLNAGIFIHYGYKEMCEALNVTHSEFLKYTGTYGVMQLEGTISGEIFVKAFLPMGQSYLHSDTDNFADELHVTTDCIHPIDWNYVPTFDAIKGEVKDDKLYLDLSYCPPAIPLEEFVLNYAGQVIKLVPGDGIYVFDFVPGEDAYVGEPYHRNKGRMIDIERLLKCDKLG